jgi:hypothetical protein
VLAVALDCGVFQVDTVGRVVRYRTESIYEVSSRSTQSPTLPCCIPTKLLSRLRLLVEARSVVAPGDLNAYGLALKRTPTGLLALRAVALFFLPLQKFAEQCLALLLRKVRGSGAFILEESGKVVASDLWVHSILRANTT